MNKYYIDIKTDLESVKILKRVKFFFIDMSYFL